MQDILMDNVSIDCVVFGFDGDDLKILCIKRNTEPSFGMMSLPGGFVYLHEDINEAPARRLKDLTGLSKIYLREVQTFGTIHRYPLRRVITVAYYALICIADYNVSAGEDAQEALWIPITKVPPLAFYHNKIVEVALEKLQKQVRIEPLGFNLLPKKFTITELQTLYEKILNTSFDKRNFRKKLAKMNVLIDTNEKQQNVSHRAAKLYMFDEKAYKTLQKKGCLFDL